MDRIAVALIVLVAASCAGGPPDLSMPASVDAVIDGDTLRVVMDGRRETVRLAGVDAPEQGECAADAATSLVADLAAGGMVTLEPAGGDDRDRFGRLLRYVWSADTLINLELVAQGLALSVSGDHRRERAFDDAADRAWRRRTGLWSPFACGAGPPAGLQISEIDPDPAGNDAERPNAETVTVVNPTGATVELSRWRLRDESSTHRFAFPDGYALAPGARVTVHSGCGEDTATDLYWCAGPVWSNRGDTAILQAPDGTVADRLSYRN